MPHDILLVIVSFFTGNGTAIIGRWLGRKKTDADAAKTLTEVAVQVANLNLQLSAEVKNLKDVINILTDTLDEILPHISGLSAAQLRRLKDANSIAKLSI